MGKLKVLFARVCSGSFKRMFMYIDEIKKESGNSKLFTFADMMWCIARYGIGYLEYRVFGFCYLRGSKIRKTYIKMADNLLMVKKLNNSEYTHFLSDKLDFNNRFQKYLGRDFIDLHNATADDLKSFLQDKGVVFCKAVSSFGGQGIEKVNVSDIDDVTQFYNECVRKGQYNIEEAVIQHSELSRLNPSSINTLRIVTICKDGCVHHMYTLIRIGKGNSCVDNISSGGMYAPVDENGVITKPAFCDKTGKLYEIHPDTKTSIVGFRVPMFDKAVQICKEAALSIPEMGYVGWDVAMTENGPVFIEGNEMPGYDMCQNYYHIGDNKSGLKPKFEEILGKDFFKR